MARCYYCGEPIEDQANDGLCGQCRDEIARGQHETERPWYNTESPLQRLARQTVEQETGTGYTELTKVQLGALWDMLDSHVFGVVDEREEQIANAQIRRLPNGEYLYADDVDGFSVLSAAEASALRMR